MQGKWKWRVTVESTREWRRVHLFWRSDLAEWQKQREGVTCCDLAEWRKQREWRWRVAVESKVT
eukprot:3149980-Rhodomonas_salina.2